MNFETLMLEKKESICTITLNMPENLNAITTKLSQELYEALQKIKADTDCLVVILTGTGKGFIGGADIKHMVNLDALGGSQFGYMVSRSILEMEKMDKVFIAAVNGYALGAGFEVALGCDIRIFSTGAKVGLPETGLGVMPGAGGTQRLQRLVGIGKANEMIFTGDILSAKEAFSLGIANKLVEPEALMDAAFEMAGKISSKSPTGIRLAKEAIQKGKDMDLEKAVEYEKNLFGLCFSTAEKTEGMTAFIEKRKPVFKR